MGSTFVEFVEDLSDYSIPTVSVRSENGEMESVRVESVLVDAVERELFVIEGILGSSKDPGLDAMLIVWKYTQLHVGIKDTLSLGVDNVREIMTGKNGELNKLYYQSYIKVIKVLSKLLKV